MTVKKIVNIVLVGFVLFCGILVAKNLNPRRDNHDSKPCILLQSQNNPGPTDSPEMDRQKQNQIAPDPNPVRTYSADNEKSKVVTIGSLDPNSGYKFQLQLTNKGAAIRKATMSEFDDRDYKNPQPLALLSPVYENTNKEILSMANEDFIFVSQSLQLPLDKLNWQGPNLETTDQGGQLARFEAVIKEIPSQTPVVKITKTYTLIPNEYHLYCDIDIVNLTEQPQKIRFNMNGLIGIDREEDMYDRRMAVGGFKNQNGEFVIETRDVKKLKKADTVEDKRLTKGTNDFIWAAITNKYFSAILVPLCPDQKTSCDWIYDKTAHYYNPDGDEKDKTGDETIAVKMKMKSTTLIKSSEQTEPKHYRFLLYLGPKQKSLFDKDELYKKLGFIHSITFRPCFCCPGAIITPIALGILGLMKWLHQFIPNYGIVIMILVFIVRLILHPLTKKGQVSMSKMTKLGPKMEEIKNKYANNKAEQNKQMMALYREQGFSPFTSMLPMFIQMPIWIALWNAVSASIELRGEPFWPTWIKDLSAPDALFRFPAFDLPLFGTIDSFNLLPILMGVAFYLQQKLMPSQQTASTNPQMEQQQKIMKIMLPIMFPLMLYKGPSGVNLYIMSSVFAGVIEQYVIRKHIREKEEKESKGLLSATKKTGGKVKKKKPKPFYKM